MPFVACSLKKRNIRWFHCDCNIEYQVDQSDTAYTLCERGKTNKKANAVDAEVIAAANVDEQAVLHDSLYDISIEYGFPSELCVFKRPFESVCPQHTTITTARYFFLSSYMHTECSLRKITSESCRCHREARWIWNYWRAIRADYSFFLFLVRKILNAEENQMRDTSCIQFSC